MGMFITPEAVLSAAGRYFLVTPVVLPSSKKGRSENPVLRSINVVVTYYEIMCHKNCDVLPKFT